MVGINRPYGISTHHKNAKISLEDNCGLSGVSIVAFNSITIGNNVLVGANTVITDFDWHVDSRLSEKMPSAPIIIEDDVWIGMNFVVLKGVHIGKRTIIGANSVVTSHVPADVIVAGNPVHLIRQLNHKEEGTAKI